MRGENSFIQLLPIIPLEMVVYPKDRVCLEIRKKSLKKLINECIQNEGDFGIVPIILERLFSYGVKMEILPNTLKYEGDTIKLEAKAGQIFKLVEIIDTNDDSAISKKPFQVGQVKFRKKSLNKKPTVFMQKRAERQYLQIKTLLIEKAGYFGPYLENLRLSRRSYGLKENIIGVKAYFVENENFTDFYDKKGLTLNGANAKQQNSLQDSYSNFLKKKDTEEMDKEFSQKPVSLVKKNKNVLAKKMMLKKVSQKRKGENSLLDKVAKDKTLSFLPTSVYGLDSFYIAKQLIGSYDEERALMLAIKTEEKRISILNIQMKQLLKILKSLLED